MMERVYQNISVLFMLIFIGILWGFHAYTMEFPEFKSFQLTHHIHGGLMMSWLLMLIAQPILIVTGRVDTHRTIGKLAYIIGPMITIYLFLIAQLGYSKNVVDRPEFARAVMVLDLRGLFFFTLLYILALSFRKTTAYHMRFMIGTGLLMIGPGFGRALIHSFGLTLWDAMTYTDYVAIFITLAFLIYDFLKKNPMAPYTIVLLVLVLEKLLWHYRMSDAWQSFAGWFAARFF